MGAQKRNNTPITIKYVRLFKKSIGRLNPIPTTNIYAIVLPNEDKSLATQQAYRFGNVNNNSRIVLRKMVFNRSVILMGASIN